MKSLKPIFTLLLVLPTFGCTKQRTDLDYSYNVAQVISMDEQSIGDIVQFENVFWEADDSTSLRKMITEDGIARGRKVLEIGTGTGLIAITCAAHGAKEILATDINPAAVANARYNAAMLQLDDDLEVRQVDAKDPGAFAVLKPGEQFDLIVSNPPWEDGTVNKPLDYAFYDPGFALMDSILDGLPSRLSPGGRCLLAYGHVPAIERLLSESELRGFQVNVLDDRKLDDLPENFLPGMLIELRLGRDQIPKVGASQDE
ncbi:methyltransferase domain-containing protein [Stieleria sp. JC731]|uniref:methyltransferase n=1 Tax=Pirellulaceae TaxID=2691357 RepID=UPI001E494033|nr:50S ribosomal protein L11 methyltransferase [Stieleria sp. JC731]MCC9604124.1 methyltransferase domain-containing protein [Stieleria sp. JC731]